MNIYKVESLIKLWYDTYDSFICFAESEEQAKNLNPGFPNIFNTKFQILKNDPNYHVSFYMKWNDIGEDYDEDDRHNWVRNKKDLKVTKIGETDFTQVGVVLASYNAG